MSSPCPKGRVSQASGFALKTGTIVDATLIGAPSSNFLIISSSWLAFSASAMEFVFRGQVTDNIACVCVSDRRGFCSGFP